MTQSREGHSLACTLDPTYLCGRDDTEPFLLQDLGEPLSDFWLVARQNALAARDKRDLGSKASKHLAQFQGNVAAAQNEQRARLFSQFGPPGIIRGTQEIAGQIGNVSQSRKRRNRWGRTGRDQNLVAHQATCGIEALYLYLVVGDECRLT